MQKSFCASEPSVYRGILKSEIFFEKDLTFLIKVKALPASDFWKKLYEISDSFFLFCLFAHLRKLNLCACVKHLKFKNL